MVVDMTTGLYYFFSQAASIFAPSVVGDTIDVTGYQSLLVFSVLFFVLALISIQFVRRGDIVKHKGDIYDYVPDID